MVSFTSVPPEADVYINDIYEGKTPVEKKMSNSIFKNAKIRMEKKGYESKTKYVDKEAKIVPILFCWVYGVPLLWCYGPEAKQHFVLKRMNTTPEGNNNIQEGINGAEDIYTEETLALFKFDGTNKNGGNMPITVRYSGKDLDLYFYDLFTTYGISLNTDARKDFIEIIDKALEWDEAAKKNNITEANKEIAKLGGKCFFEMTDWFYTNYTTIPFWFVIVGKKGFLFIPSIRMQAKNNEFISSVFDGVFIPVSVLPELKRAISDENILAKIKEAGEKKEKEDAIFR